MIIYKWTDGNDEDFQRFYLKTEEYYSSIVGGIENRKGFIVTSKGAGETLVSTGAFLFLKQ